VADACEQYLKTNPDIGRDHGRAVRCWGDAYGGRTLPEETTPWFTEIRDDPAAGSYAVGPKG